MRRRLILKRRAHAASSLAFLLGCAASQPEEALERYRAHLKGRDVAGLVRESDASSRGLFSPEELAEVLAEDPAAVEALLTRLSAEVEVRSMELVLKSGARIKLTNEGSAWRVASGGVEQLLGVDPIGALARFLRAAEARRFDQVRQAIPAAELARFPDDEALARHLEVLAPRLAGARDAVTSGVPSIAGDQAEIHYPEGRVARLVREGGRWKVLDLE